jgi:hypothetical protein
MFRHKHLCVPCVPFVHSSLLLDTCRNVAQTHNCQGVDVIAALLHFVAKELAVRLPAFREADVMGLAQVLRV